MGLIGSRYGPAALPLGNRPVTRSIGDCVGSRASLENLAASGTRSPHRQAYSQLQYRLNYPHNGLLEMYIITVRCGEFRWHFV
jgi:hypothetical protein